MGIILHEMSPEGFTRIFGGLLFLIGLLYLLRERRRVVVVPYIGILKEAMDKAFFERSGGRWRRFGSFLTQGLLLLCAVLALADPEWDGQWALMEGDRDRRDEPKLVLLLDRSLSMDMSRSGVRECAYPASTRESAGLLDPSPCAFSESSRERWTTFDVAKGRAAYLIHESEPGTRVLMATLDRRVSVHSVWQDRQRALDALAGLERTDLEDTPSAAKTWLQNARDNHPGARIHVITDLQRSEQWVEAKAGSWLVEGVGKSGANLVLERFRVRADITRPGSAIARCSVSYAAGLGGPAHVDFILEIRASSLLAPQDELVVGVERRRLPQGRGVDIDFDLTGLPGGILKARLILDDPELDSIPADSQRWAAIPALRPVRVGAVGEIPPYLLAALVADPFVELLEPVESLDHLSAETEIQLFVGAVPDKLSGPTLIFDPPVKAHPLASVLEIEAGEARAVKNPFWKRFDPGEITFQRGLALIPSKGERPLLQSGKVVVATIGRKDGFPLLRLGLDPAESQIGSSPFFPALVARSIDFLQTRLDLVGREYHVGSIEFDSNLQPGLSALYSSAGELVSFSSAGDEKFAWIGLAGLYLAHDKDRRVEPVIVGVAGDKVEGLARGTTLLSNSPERRAGRAFSRGGLWYLALWILGLGLVLEHFLFVRRRIW